LCNVDGIHLLPKDKQRATALPELLLRGCKFFIIWDVLNFPSTPVVYVSKTGARATCAG
jgi:hypothetical protein